MIPQASLFNRMLILSSWLGSFEQTQEEIWLFLSMEIIKLACVISFYTSLIVTVSYVTRITISNR